MPHRRPPVFLFVLALSIAADAGAAELEEVVVSARLGERDGERTSVTVLPAELVRSRAAVHLEDVLSAAPNTHVSSGASRGRFFQIRGIGERSQFVEPVNASVGLILDGIDLTGLGGTANLADIDQIEVLRGPQGTLAGANALAGLINLRSTPADTGRELRLSGGVESYDGARLGVVTGGNIVGTIAGRLALSQYRNDGYTDNTWLNRDDSNAREETTFRGQLSGTWARQRLDAGIHFIDANNGYDAFSLDNTRATLSDQPGWDDTRTIASRLRWQSFGDQINLMAQASYATTATDYAYDEDWSYVGIAPGLEYSAFDRYRRDRDMGSLELRAASASDNDSPTWVVGSYLRREDEDLRRDYSFLDAPFSSDLGIDTAAVFGQLDVPLAATVNGFLGLRLEHRGYDYADSAAVTETLGETLWSGQTGISWDVSARHSLYAKLSRGVRGGGVNATALASADAFEDPDIRATLRDIGFFDAESLLSGELGWRYRSTDGRLASRLAVFTMARRDQQARGSLVIPRPNGSTAFIDYTDNAARGTNRGIEWEWDWLAHDRLTLSAALGLLDARFDTYTTALGEDLSGRDQPQAPSWQYRLAADWSVHPRWSAGLEATGMDSHFFSDRHDTRAVERHLLNAHISWAAGAWRVRVWGRNLTDTDYFVRGFGSFGNDPRKGYAVEPYYQFGEPRVLGVTLDYDFLLARQ